MGTVLPLRPSVPVVPGHAGVTHGTTSRPACVACGATDPQIARKLTDLAGVGQGRDDSLSYVMLCIEPIPCARRYRAGATPEQFAARLREEVTV